MPSWSITKGTVIVGRCGAKIISISLTTVSRGHVRCPVVSSLFGWFNRVHGQFSFHAFMVNNMGYSHCWEMGSKDNLYLSDNCL